VTSESLPPDDVPTEWSCEPNRIIIPATVSQVKVVPTTPAPPTRWANYVDTLPNWEKILLQHVQFVDRAQLLVEFRTTTLLLLASDGGANSLQGSFSCLLATTETILFDCGGRAYGSDPRSFRAEGYGMLTILRLVHHIHYFYVTGNSALTFRLYCDSDSLIKRLQASLALRRPAPRRYLFSEADIEMEIIAAIHTLGTVDLVHVYGHQNERDSAEPLSWEATLNQHCDDIATKHLEATVGSYPLVPFLHSSKVSLPVQGNTITHHIPTHLDTYAGLPELRDYKYQHHGWDPQIFDLIDWPTLHSWLHTNALLLKAPIHNQVDERPVAVPGTTVQIQPKPVTTMSLSVRLQGRSTPLSTMPPSRAQTQLARIRPNTLRNL
jgi:hypothetical protein